ncbi:MAG: hypothetical protein V4449_02075 [Patescibacteria group bacterium]
MFKTLAKLRRAPNEVRQNFTAFITVIIVACITLIWFFFFITSLFSTDFSKGLVPAVVDTPAPETPAPALEAPFAN